MVDIATGPSAGKTVMGICGSSGEGSKADTIGVYEFDTVSKKIVGSHNIDPALGFGAEQATSPDGLYILLLGKDGGKAVRLLLAGENGESSTFLVDLPVNFQGGLSSNGVVSDFAFVSMNNRNMLVLGASTDNNIAIVDLDDDDFRMTKLALTDSAESTGGQDRHMEWVVDTNYVWVTGGEAAELYVVELGSTSIEDSKLSKTISGVPAGDIYVENYERRAAMEVLLTEGNRGQISTLAGVSSEEDDADKFETLAIVAVVLGAVGVLVSVMSLFVATKKSASPSQASKHGGDDKGSPSGTESKVEIETKTLGSKMVT